MVRRPVRASTDPVEGLLVSTLLLDVGAVHRDLRVRPPAQFAFCWSPSPAPLTPCEDRQHRAVIRSNRSRDLGRVAFQPFCRLVGGSQSPFPSLPPKRDLTRFGLAVRGVAGPCWVSKAASCQHDSGRLRRKKVVKRSQRDAHGMISP